MAAEGAEKFIRAEVDLVNIEEQKSKAMAFRAMHRSGKMLVLPNAWDVASARVFEEAGFGAIATTSAGVAFSLRVYPIARRFRGKRCWRVPGELRAQ